MNTAEKKVVQYLAEARATEDALTRVLQSQIAMTWRSISTRPAVTQRACQTACESWALDPTR